MIDIKTQEQNKAIQAIVNNDYNGIILATVAFGKGRVMIKCLEKLIREKGIKSVLYTCDNTRLKEVDFPAELEKWGTPEMKAMVQIQCYQTTYKWEGKKFDLLLADEFDFSLTKEYIKVYFNNTFKYKILLSGTLSAPKKKLALTIAPIVYKITTTEAEEKKLINKSTYYIYNYRMSEEESREYLKWTRLLGKAMAAQKPENQLNFLRGKRKELLYTLDSSVNHCKRVMKWLWNQDKQTRLVIFSERTEQADRLCKWSYHGKNVGENNLNKFQAGEISGISVVSKIKRGINLKNANTAIFEMLGGGSTTEFEQKNGRMKRLPIAEIAKVIFMVPWFQTTDKDGLIIFKPTIVDDWLYKATCNLSDIQFKNLKL